MKQTVLLLLIFFFSFKGFSQDIKKAASEYCDCYASIVDSVHREFIPYIVAAADSSNFRMKLVQIVPRESKDYVQTLSSAVAKIRRTMFDPGTVVGKCGNDLKMKYYSYLYDAEHEREFFKKIIKELESNVNCSFYVAMLKSMYM